MWMLEVTVPLDMEEIIDDLTGDPTFVFQCWGKTTGDKITLRYAFRDNATCKKSYFHICKLPEAEGLRVWHEDAEYQDKGSISKDLARRVISGDAEAARQWLTVYKDARLVEGVWYRRRPNGRYVRMTPKYQAIHERALAIHKGNGGDDAQV